MNNELKMDEIIGFRGIRRRDRCSESGELPGHQRFGENVGNAAALGFVIGGVIVAGYEQSERGFEVLLA